MLGYVLSLMYQFCLFYDGRLCLQLCMFVTRRADMQVWIFAQ